MKVIGNTLHIHKEITKLKRRGKKIAFVATMGALHAGHSALIRKARKTADIVIVSIYVNKLQFGPREDYSRYPRNINNDLLTCRAQKVDIVFNPKEDDFYSDTHSTYVNEDVLSVGLCGKNRKEHFEGVTTVLAKLFNSVRPDIVYFGQKDYQQYKVVERMVRDLQYPIKVVMVPTVREKDGLALSSRNAYLTAEQRKKAAKINMIIKEGIEKYAQEANVATAENYMCKKMKSIGIHKIDYVKIVKKDNLSDKIEKNSDIVCAVAVWVGKVRLIDNIIMKCRKGA
ncbi:MAG: pantoate--beta-alanine ligase [Candidatus Ancaeobacter aquaticus]|nr:pantoate--beta-alanine ligase [Candidatus Ancaeobacter aquaticus]